MFDAYPSSPRSHPSGSVFEPLEQRVLLSVSNVVTERVSVSTGGAEGNDMSWHTSVSAGGRLVSFESRASNLVPGDTNGYSDIFVRDRLTGVTERVSVATDGSEGNLWSTVPRISADGRFIAFASSASNLIPDDTNSTGDVFVHDRQTGVTERVSVATDGRQASAGGGSPAISADGRLITFFSASSDLVAGDRNGTHDVFVHDRQTGVTERVSVASDGEEGDGNSTAPSISVDGRFVSFRSEASNLTSDVAEGNAEIYVHDRQSGITERVSGWSDEAFTVYGSLQPAISGDGRWASFVSYTADRPPGAASGNYHVYLHDRQAGVTQRVSVSAGGEQVNGSSFSPSFSEDGRFLVFDSNAPNLVTGDANGSRDVFIYDLQTAVTERVNVGSSGEEGNSYSRDAVLSADGRFVAYESQASNLVPGDTNGTLDVFVHDRLSGQPTGYPTIFWVGPDLYASPEPQDLYIYGEDFAPDVAVDLDNLDDTESAFIDLPIVERGMLDDTTQWLRVRHVFSEPASWEVTVRGFGATPSTMGFVVHPKGDPPAVVDSAFLYEWGHIIEMTFSESVEGSLSAEDLVVQNLTMGQTVPVYSFGYHPIKKEAGFGFYPALPDGNYRATLPAESVEDEAGNPMSEDFVLDFFVLAGDADRDRDVDFFDFLKLRSNYGQTGKLFSDGDFDYDSDVDFFDFLILRGNYGVTLPPPGGSGSLFDDGEGSGGLLRR